MELIDLIPNSMSFRIVSTLDLGAADEVPGGFTGRVRRLVDRRIVAVGWFQDGKLHNPSRHHPAYRVFRDSGKLKYEMWYSAGCLDDPEPGVPAVRGYFVDGTVHYEEHWRTGQRHDGADGSAAIRKWRADGSLRHELRYHQGYRTG